MLSRKAKYGLKAMLRLATTRESGPMLVSDLAATESIPKKFLEQILLELKHRGLLQSKKGKGGGYMLTRPSCAISMGEVIRALDGPIAPIPCVSQTAYVKCDECEDERTCGIRMVMKRVRDATVEILESSNLADVVKAVAAAEADLGIEAALGVGGAPPRTSSTVQPLRAPRASVVSLPAVPATRSAGARHSRT
jgi:Rrf2 family protein